MRKNEALSIRVPTETLRDILKDVPEALVELEAVAIEKIAEELNKKVGNSMRDKVVKYAQQVVDEANRKLKSQYSFPPEAKAIIDDFARKMVAEHVEGDIRRATNDLAAANKKLTAATVLMMQEAIDKAYDAREASLDAKIKELARTEFFNVLAEARDSVKDAVPEKVSDTAPVLPHNCRESLRRTGQAYPKSGCLACGTTIRTGLKCLYGA